MATGTRESRALLERIRSRVLVDEGGCWLWQGAVNSKGYPQIGVKVRYGRGGSISRSVHRLVVDALHGPLGPKDLACHRCNVKRCVNPKHLYKGDAFTNAADRTETEQLRAGILSKPRRHSRLIVSTLSFFAKSAHQAGEVRP